MGIPKFYRWLSERFPLINQYVSSTSPIPEFDNLYLDMNGIIHNCFHPKDDNSPKSAKFLEQELFLLIFAYIDKLFQIIKPKKTFYMAIDGVAPRAKMNQQRARRFKTAKDSKEAFEAALAKGDEVEKPLDSNCITPGTEFMARLSTHLHYFITRKIQEDAAWQQCRVIFSGHEVPGEGEHKIMEFIRAMKSQPGYQPNQRHCIYGLDADLIMLSLVSHEPLFALLREEVTFGPANTVVKKTNTAQRFQLLHISILRESFNMEFQHVVDKLPFAFNLERVIDDWVFMCCFVGNDFMPCLPTMDIAEGGLNTLLDLYKQLLPGMGGYLTDCGVVNLERAEALLTALGQFEESVLLGRQADEQQSRRRPRHRPNRFQERDIEGDDAGEADEEDSEAEFSLFGSRSEYYSRKLNLDVSATESLETLKRCYAEALQWVMAYYYKGVPSWGWFFPYNYTPLASDLTGLHKYQIQFNLGKPFLPFQQLLGVLPGASAGLLPEAYQELMLRSSSPIIDFYPGEFPIDMDRKRHAWEGIPILPFIDEQRLLFNLPNDSRITVIERKRNSFGEAFEYKYDRSVEPYKCMSTLPGVLPHINGCRVRQTVFLLPPMPASGFVPDIVPGQLMGWNTPAGFPTFGTMPHSSFHAAGKVNVFGRPSKMQSLVVVVEPDDDLLANPDADTVAAQLMGKIIWVNWPYLVEARVVGAEDMKKAIYCEGGETSTVERDQYVMDKFRRDCETIASNELTKHGLQTGAVKCVLTVEPVVGVTRHLDGSLKKRFGDEQFQVALQLTQAHHANPDRRFAECLPQSSTDQFPVGSQGVYTAKFAPGCVCTITGHDEKNQLNVLVDLIPEPPAFAIQIMRQFRDNYVQPYRIAKELGLSMNLLSMMSSSMLANPGRKDIGMAMKFERRNLQLPGYTRRRPDGQWEFSDLAKQALVDYVNAFPELFAMIRKNEGARMVDISAAYPDVDPEEQLEKITKWIAKHPVSGRQLVTVGALHVTDAACKSLQAFVDQFYASEQGKAAKKVVNGVPASALCPPLSDDMVLHAPNNLFLGCRVVSIASGGGVPFGLRGTVVALLDDRADVIFDSEFMRGTPLGGRCSNLRGFTCSRYQLYNLNLNSSPPPELVPVTVKAPSQVQLQLEAMAQVQAIAQAQAEGRPLPVLQQQQHQQYHSQSPDSRQSPHQRQQRGPREPRQPHQPRQAQDAPQEGAAPQAQHRGPREPRQHQQPQDGAPQAPQQKQARPPKGDGAWSKGQPRQPKPHAEQPKHVQQASAQAPDAAQIPPPAAFMPPPQGYPMPYPPPYVPQHYMMMPPPMYHQGAAAHFPPPPATGVPPMLMQLMAAAQAAQGQLPPPPPTASTESAQQQPSQQAAPSTQQQQQSTPQAVKTPPVPAAFLPPQLYMAPPPQVQSPASPAPALQAAQPSQQPTQQQTAQQGLISSVMSRIAHNPFMDPIQDNAMRTLNPDFQPREQREPRQHREPREQREHREPREPKQKVWKAKPGATAPAKDQ
eukprot:TRINITY_DN14417_c0_g1_i1.p1 TRINITY_DN14417_c0_g1~~TRINITY_DN14417_c0_g1_i1.p1  ORF type:complete len:1502 (+),score=374.72 TRINITY_DN14417_c0_g1_i1:39-4544(+)